MTIASDVATPPTPAELAARRSVSIPASSKSASSESAKPASSQNPARQRRGRIDRVPGLDGLRGIAVLGVVIYHFFGDWLPGGYLGVDVFFVLSGFLITSLLLRERAMTGRISLKDFWLRRLRRIAPLAISVLVLTTVAVGILFAFTGTDLAVRMRTQFFSTFFFVNNWAQIAQGQSYFDDQSVQITAHYWSLAIEEQYYILWPLLVIGAIAVATRGRAKPNRDGTRQIHTRPLGIGALVLAVASALWMEICYYQAVGAAAPGAPVDPSRMYYGTDTHAFGLLLGSALAVRLTSTDTEELGTSFPASRALLPQGRAGSWIAGLAFIGLLAFMLTVPDQSAFAYSGGIALACVLTAIVVAGIVGNAESVSEWANLHALRWLGQRSFSIYLWHWPVFFLGRELAPHAAGWQLPVAAIIITLVLSELSFRGIENPVRRRGYRACIRALVRTTWVRSTAVVLLAATLTAGVAFTLVTAPNASQLERNLAAIQAELKSNAVPPAGTPSPAAQPAPSATDAPTTTDAAASASATSSEATSTINPARKPRGIIGEAPAKPPRVKPQGTEMTAVGDSVLLASAQALQEHFPGITVDGAVSRHYTEALTIIQNMKAQGTLGKVVIMGLGTNGPSYGAGDDQMLNEVRDVVGPDRLLIYVLPYGDRWYMPEAESELITEAKTHPNVYIANWCDAAKHDHSYLRDDGIHPTGPGAEAYATAIESAIDQWVKDDKVIPGTCGV